MTCPNCGAALETYLPDWLDEMSGITILTLRCGGCGQTRIERKPDAEQGSLFGADPAVSGDAERSE